MLFCFNVFSGEAWGFVWDLIGDAVEVGEGEPEFVFELTDFGNFFL